MARRRGGFVAAIRGGLMLAQREGYSPIKPRLARRGENRVPLPGRRGFLSQGASEIGGVYVRKNPGPLEKASLVAA
jgi:hypothetical protein